MDYPKHTPLAVAALAVIAGGYAAVRPQPAPLEPPHMVALSKGQELGRQEARSDCEKACAHLVDVMCSEGSDLYCVPKLQVGAPPMNPATLASCSAIAQAIDVDDARRMGVRCE